MGLTAGAVCPEINTESGCGRMLLNPITEVAALQRYALHGNHRRVWGASKIGQRSRILLSPAPFLTSSFHFKHLPSHLEDKAVWFGRPNGLRCAVCRPWSMGSKSKSHPQRTGPNPTGFDPQPKDRTRLLSILRTAWPSVSGTDQEHVLPVFLAAV